MGIDIYFDKLMHKTIALTLNDDIGCLVSGFFVFCFFFPLSFEYDFHTVKGTEGNYFVSVSMIIYDIRVNNYCIQKNV